MILEKANKVYDLHCHSTASDGELRPRELVSRAHEYGVNVLALTDHDTVAGISEAQDRADELGLKLIHGIEISTRWKQEQLHIVGLNIDIEHDAMKRGIRIQQETRLRRTEIMASRLEKMGIKGALEGGRKESGNEVVGRRHFANFLVNEGYAKDFKEVFSQYIGDRCPAYVELSWTSMENAVDWINKSGGVAVIAHPSHYGFPKAQQRDMAACFKIAGGSAIEASYGHCGGGIIQRNCSIANRYDLAVSMGSDFHSPKDKWNQLGCAELPPENFPRIWEQENW